jgi:hypothetical protein
MPMPLPKLPPPVLTREMTLSEAADYATEWAKLRGSYAPGAGGLRKAIMRGRLKAKRVVAVGQPVAVWIVMESDLLDYLVSRMQHSRPGSRPGVTRRRIHHYRTPA